MWISLGSSYYLCFLDLAVCFLPTAGKVLDITSSNILSSLFSHFSFWNPYSANIGVLDAIPGISSTILINFFFSYCCSDWVISTLGLHITTCSSVLIILLISVILYFRLVLYYISISLLSCFLLYSQVC